MPPKILDNSSSSSKERGNRRSRQQAGAEELAPGQPNPPPTMATRTQTAGHPIALYDVPGPIRLPPILPLPPAIAASRSISMSASTSPQGPENRLHFSPGPYTPSGPRPTPYGYFPTHDRQQPTHLAPMSPTGSNPAVRNSQHEPSIPHKRPYEASDSSYGPPPPLSLLTPASIPPRNPYAQNVLQPLSTQSSVSSASTPTGRTASFPLPGQIPTFSRPASEISSNTITSRCSLHIRQQPRAARAGPDGKDRRNIDPPPVLQLLLTDFDSESATDLSELKSNHYVVHCKLISPDSPRRDVTTQTTVSEDGSRETSRLLLGTNVASPFFCADDPDIANMPQHPKLADPLPEAPPSPSSRFIQISSRRIARDSASPPSHSGTSEAGAASSKPKSEPATLPGAFFIFADLSVRRAGSYRLEFTLMKIDPSATNLPMIHICASQTFKVVNAKDFDQVHPSTRLVRGLLERGAPFPLKLKKGIREGQRRRTAGEEGGSVEGSIEEDRGGVGDEEEEGED